MGPKNKFLKEQIIDTAFDIARTDGIDGITMRKIAQKMGSSVAPIYVNFKNIDELLDALLEKIVSISQQLLKEEDSGNPFRDIGRASLRFAMEYSVVFKDLVTKHGKYIQGFDEKMMPFLIEEMQNDPELKGFTVEELRNILLKMRIFQLGLSMMAASSLLPEDYSNQDMMDILSSTANDVIMSAKMKRGQTERE